LEIVENVVVVRVSDTHHTATTPQTQHYHSYYHKTYRECQSAKADLLH